MIHIKIRRPTVDDRGCIVDTIEYGPASDLICTCTNGEYENLYELGTAFVRPDYQGQGIGNLLLNSMTQVLIDKGIKFL